MAINENGRSVIQKTDRSFSFVTMENCNVAPTFRDKLRGCRQRQAPNRTDLIHLFPVPFLSPFAAAVAASLLPFFLSLSFQSLHCPLFAGAACKNAIKLKGTRSGAVAGRRGALSSPFQLVLDRTLKNTVQCKKCMKWKVCNAFNTGSQDAVSLERKKSMLDDEEVHKEKDN